MKPALGVCYYPEHWDEALWAEDAKRMVDAGLIWVRIGEFAWSRLEASEGALTFDWLDRAIDTLGAAGLQIILGTPTATPPTWVLEKHPDMLAVDAEGRPRKFGSRRHYCFSHLEYRAEAVRIARLLAERYGQNAYIHAWQVDNEYGCHDTTISYSDAARIGFRDWLAQKYQSPDALNRAWGNVFWSMEYRDFSEIDLPNLTVTEANPAHIMDFRRFTSDQVVAFNRAQADAIRPHSDAPLIHNYMGRITDFDHYAVGADLEIASWDSYPMGFLEDRVTTTEDFKTRFAQQGDPDFQAFHHDLYRAVGRGRWWIMEQQPGPVNWAPWNPAPLDGMVKTWGMEAVAHGAEAVCFFRWRQAPFAQEQMHAGLLRPDGAPAEALGEVHSLAHDVADLGDVEHAQAPVALVFDYASQWAHEIQPQGADFDYFQLVYETYIALRKLGLSVDILPPELGDLSGYKMLVAPGLWSVPNGFFEKLAGFKGHTLLGPRFNLKTQDFSIPTPLPPNIPDLDITVNRVETVRPTAMRPVASGGNVKAWMEDLHADMTPILETADNKPLAYRSGQITYLGAWLDDVALSDFLFNIAGLAGIETKELPEGLRIRDTASHRFWFNYSATPQTHGSLTIPAAGYAIERK